MYRIENFQQPTLPAGFFWFHEPSTYHLGAGLKIVTDANTDFWQKTHYGFQHDDGHALLTNVTGDFCLKTHVEFQPQQQYDQCGLLVRMDEHNWIKVSTEFEDAQHSRLGSVVTNLGYSDWATQDISSTHRALWYRISRNGADFLLESSFDGQQWSQLRITHLHQPLAQLQIGVYACSPLGKEFWCKFNLLEIAENRWSDGSA